MSDVTQAANDLKNLSNKLRPLLELGPILERIGSIEQTELDTLARVKLANEAEKQAKADLGFAEEKLSRARLELEAAKSAVAKEFKDGSEKRDALIKQGETEAESIIAKAEFQKENILKEVANHQSAVDRLQKDIDAKAAELANVQKKVQEVKARIAGL